MCCIVVLSTRDNYILSFFQAILFYVPRWLWKNWEAGKVAALRMDLNLGIISEVEKKLKKKLLIEYMYSNLKHHNFWAYRYFFCELLALINVGGKLAGSRSRTQQTKDSPSIFQRSAGGYGLLSTFFSIWAVGTTIAMKGIVIYIHHLCSNERG